MHVPNLKLLLALLAASVGPGLLIPIATTAAAGSDTGQHGPITITSNSDFTGVGATTGCACVTAGTGTAGDPYVIGPWAINAPSAGTHGWAIQVDNSAGGVTDSFMIRGISIGYTGVPFTDPAIQLIEVNNPAGTTISNVSANEVGRGVELDGSLHITLDQLNLNKLTGNSLFINGSSYVTLSNSKLKSTADGQVPHNADGLYAVNSDHLTIGGCPTAQVCNTFDYDTGWGVYLQNTKDVQIDHASANADDTGAFVLDNSSYVDLGNSSAGAGGPICITLSGQKTPTGYVPTDLQGGVLLINGSHDNAIHDDQIATHVGFSIGSGGNGFYANPCARALQPFNPTEPPMGLNNSFLNVCYASNDIGLPPDPCK
jgi:hypothetical protein